MHSSSHSLAGRAVLALALTVGFYGLALALIAVLLFIPYAEITRMNRIHVRLALFCLVGAGTIAWSILPRRQQFEAPGLRLDTASQPRLFEEIERVARDVGQVMPEDVYLVPSVNAFVAERGGILGIGSRRIMGLGLPLLQTLTVSQLRAVIAHEFGHYHSGDTRLGPWIYKVRSVIGRTIVNLGDSWLQKPFLWYGKLFLRITHAISRHQEFVADRVAAETAGADSLIQGLRTTYKVGSAFDVYLQKELVPVLDHGYRPSFTQGFSAFIAAPSIATAMERSVAAQMDNAETDPYDTHPSLRERIAALEADDVPLDDTDEAPALFLLEDVPALEQQLLATTVGEDEYAQWKPVEWQDVGEVVYVPAWREAVSPYAETLAGVTPESLPQFLREPERLVRRIQASAEGSVSGEDLRQMVTTITAMALAVTLAEQGWKLDASPGYAVTARRNDLEVKPFSVVRELESSELAAAAWRERCREAGIVGIDLGAAVQPA